MDIKTEAVQILRINQDKIAENIVNSQISGTDFTAIQKQASIRDAKYNIESLANAIEIESVANFNDYIIWLRDILRTYNFEEIMLIDHLNLLLDYVMCNYNEEIGKIVKLFIDEGIDSILNSKEEEHSYLDNSGELKTLAQNYFNALLNMNKSEAVKLVLDVVEQDETPIEDLYMKVFTNVLYEIGRYWALRKITVGQEHFTTAVTVFTMSLLYDKIFNHEKKEYKMMGVCVGDELHEIGLRMVCDIFEIRKWDTYYLGANVPNDSVLSEVKRIKPDVLAISVTLANKVPSCTELIKSIKRECSNVKIIVGGRSFNTDKNLWKLVGADGYSSNAIEAIEIANGLMGGIREQRSF